MGDAAAQRYRDVSFWHDDLVGKGLDDLVPRPPLAGDTTVDVCIVGGGFTGLWAALAVRAIDPQASIVVLEAEIAGFGASGRNGGWCSALFPIGTADLAARSGREPALAMRRALIDTVDEVGRASAALGIDCDFARGGTHSLIRTPVAARQAALDLAEAAEYGVDQLERRTGGPLGDSLFDPACASLHPAKLVRGLARAAESRGVVVAEQTRVTGWSAHEVVTEKGTVRCDRLVVATEAWGATLAPSRRRLLPLYSLMVATEPLPESVWDEIGLQRGETVTDFRHLLVYGQRTADDRLAFGGRGARYHFGSAIRPGWDRSEKVHAHLRSAIDGLFPAAASARITHRWGGPIGVPRDWHPTVVPRRDGVVFAGGYVGDGVAASNLAGRTIGDLVTGRRTALTGLPWVGHVPPRWEPEPLRAVGVNAVVASLGIADLEERLTGRPSRVARVAALAGRG